MVVMLKFNTLSERGAIPVECFIVSFQFLRTYSCKYSIQTCFLRIVIYPGYMLITKRIRCI